MKKSIKESKSAEEVEKEIIENENKKVETVKDKINKNWVVNKELKLKSEDKKLMSSENKMNIVKEAKKMKDDTVDANENDEVKNLVKYFEDSKPKKHLTGNHEPQSRILRNDVKVSNLTKSVLRASIDLKDRCNFEESRAVFSPGKRKLDISNEPFQLGISQTPKKRRENRS